MRMRFVDIADMNCPAHAAAGQCRSFDSTTKAKTTTKTV